MSFDNSKVIVTKGYLDETANKIREKLSSQDTYTLPEFPSAIDSISGGGIDATSIDIVKELPSTLVEGAVYLIPNGEQVVPALPLSIDSTMNRWAVVANIDGTPAFPYSMTTAQIKSCTKFYAFAKNVGTTAEPQSYVGVPSTRGSYPSEMTMSDGNSVTAPTYIYKYEPTTDTDWVDVTATSTWGDVDHNVLHCIYSTVTIIRRSLNQITYEKAWNFIDTNGRLIKPEDVDEYLVYFVEDGVATNLGSHDLKWIDGYFRGDVKPYFPNNREVVNFDFSQEEYDLNRSIIRTAPEVSSYMYGAPNSASVTSGELVFNTSGSAFFHPSYYLDDYSSYEIEIKFGTVDNTQGGWELGGFKVYGQNFCVWLNYESNSLIAYNSSGNFTIPNRTLADFSNKTIKFLVTHRISPTTNDTISEVSLLFEGETTPIVLGNIDNKLPYYPFIGSLSGNAIRGIAIKSFKITESKWGEQPDDIIQPLTITANGTYTADGITVAGYSPINVNVTKVAISEFDFKGSTPYHDLVKDIDLATNMKGLSYTSGVGIMATARGNSLRTGTNFDYAGMYEVEIKFGTFDRTTALTNGNNILLKVGRSSSKLMLNYYYSSSADTGKWWIHDQSGNNIYLDSIENQPYYFENKTLIFTYGFKYVDGERVRDATNGYFYVDGVQLNSTGSGLTGDDDSQVQIVFLCDSGNNAFVGAVYESFKVWEYFDYITPQSQTRQVTETAGEEQGDDQR